MKWHLTPFLAPFIVILCVESQGSPEKDKREILPSSKQHPPEWQQLWYSNFEEFQKLTEPIFDNQTVTNMTAQLGSTAYLHCRVRNLGERTISWVRRRDWHILTFGLLTYTNDERFQMLHAEGSDDWTLQIKYVQKRDNGTYECQVSTSTGIMSHYVNLNIVVPEAFIQGGPTDHHVDLGSPIHLICVIEKSTQPPQYVFWFHNSKMINYDTSRGGITVETDPSPRTQSKLTILDATEADSGNYTCSAPNTLGASILVFVSEDAATQTPTLVEEGAQTTPSLSLRQPVPPIDELIRNQRSRTPNVSNRYSHETLLISSMRKTTIAKFVDAATQTPTLVEEGAQTTPSLSLRQPVPPIDELIRNQRSRTPNVSAGNEPGIQSTVEIEVTANEYVVDETTGPAIETEAVVVVPAVEEMEVHVRVPRCQVPSLRPTLPHELTNKRRRARDGQCENCPGTWGHPKGSTCWNHRGKYAGPCPDGQDPRECDCLEKGLLVWSHAKGSDCPRSRNQQSIARRRRGQTPAAEVVGDSEQVSEPSPEPQPSTSGHQQQRQAAAKQDRRRRAARDAATTPTKMMRTLELEFSSSSDSD